MMQVKFKKCQENAIMPTYQHVSDACADLYAADQKDSVTFDTGIALEIPEGYVGLVYPRSSISKTPYMLANSVGVIDSNYRGSVIVKFKSFESGSFYKVGDRIAQLMIIPIPKIQFIEVDELNETDRGTGGFGSTGK